MFKKLAILKIGMVLLLGIPLLCSGAFAMGNDYRGDNKGDARGDHRGDRHQMDGKQDRHYYRDGQWYKHDQMGREVAEHNLAVGAYIESLPPQHKVVVVQGDQYYYDDQRYYKQQRDGSFVVVDPPRR